MKDIERLPLYKRLAPAVVLLGAFTLAACNEDNTLQDTPTEITEKQDDYKEHPLSKLIGDTWSNDFEKEQVRQEKQKALDD